MTRRRPHELPESAVLLIGKRPPIEDGAWTVFAWDRWLYEKIELGLGENLQEDPPGRLARIAVGIGQKVAQKTGLGRSLLPHPGLNPSEREYVAQAGHAVGRPSVAHAYLRLAYDGIRAAGEVPRAEVHDIIANNTWTDPFLARQIVDLLHVGELIHLGNNEVKAQDVVPLGA